ncbi:hypothetical protein VIBNIMADA3020_890024 [Vibrio nigripulchritudo MADA3020]|nr:hypothetical protein VIBNIMADA3020_890024 [Vibrio nigripulchritudo MADA3020]
MICTVGLGGQILITFNVHLPAGHKSIETLIWNLNLLRNDKYCLTTMNFDLPSKRVPCCHQTK